MKQRIVTIFLLILLFAGAVPMIGDMPKADENTARLIEKGGKNWSSPASAPDLDAFKSTAGDRFWIWPVEDKVIEIKAGNPKITLAWRLRSGQKAIDMAEQKTFMVEIRGKSAGSQFGLRGSVEGIKQGSTEGKCEITPGPAISDYRGDAEMLLFITTKGINPSSNLLRVKVKISDEDHFN